MCASGVAGNKGWSEDTVYISAASVSERSQKTWDLKNTIDKRWI
jgi:hypothetical protein